MIERVGVVVLRGICPIDDMGKPYFSQYAAMGYSSIVSYVGSNSSLPPE